LKIIIDTREQLPFLFQKYRVETEIKTLKTGDYSLSGYENQFTIERKSMPDLFGTMGKGRKRFKKEFERMRIMKAACLVIECDSFLDLFRNPPKYTKMNAKSVWHTLLSWSLGYHIPFYFIGYNRDIAEKNVWNIIKLWHDKNCKF